MIRPSASRWARVGYHANGNMIERHDGPTAIDWTYTFDAENRLTEVSDGTTTTTPLRPFTSSR